jgi:hypothetical protein
VARLYGGGYRLAVSRREDRLRSRLAAFLREYGRTSRRPGLDPNDRQYDRILEREIKRLDPHDLDRLMRDSEEDDQ